MSSDSAPRSDPARTARTLLAPAVQGLERLVARPAYAERALGHARRAQGVLGEPTKLDFREPLDDLRAALDELRETPDEPVEFNRILLAVAHTVAFLYPIVAGSGRKPSDAPPAVKASIPPPADERRTGERLLVQADVGLLSDSNFYTGLSEDISLGGVFVATDAPLQPGTSCTLYFVLPGGRSVRADGTVRWARAGEEGRKAGMGVGFSTLADGDRRAIEAYCTRRPPLFHE